MNATAETVLNDIDPTTEFARVEKMLYKLAWNFTRSYGLDFDDARSEAFAGFMKACRNYRPRKGMKFSSWCHLVVWGKLKSHVMERARNRMIPVEINEEILGEAHQPDNARTRELVDRVNPSLGLGATLVGLICETPHELWDCAEGLSQDAEVLLDLFLEADSLPSQRRLHRAEQTRLVRQQFAERHGVRRAEAAYSELRACLLQAWS